MFEDYELFARTSGEASDVVQKEMYRFKDLGDRDLALRPEGTAGVARAYLEHSMRAGRIHRLWYMGPMFRYGRPQKGRYRQFHQIGAEIIGTAAPGADVEIIALFVDLFEAWGFSDLTVAVNSVGTPATRRAYGEALRTWLAPVEKYPEPRIAGAAREQSAARARQQEPTDLAMLRGEQGGSIPVRCRACSTSLDPESKRALGSGARGADAPSASRIEIDHGLVRGLDYYTRTAFEVHDSRSGRRARSAAAAATTD